MEKIRRFLKENGKSKTSDIAQKIGLSSVRIRTIITEMDDIETIGGNRNRTYKLK